MILEVVTFQLKPGEQQAFEHAFAKAKAIIGSMSGYISHELKRCIEYDTQYLLLVEWETLEDHTEGFRNSAQYQEWKALLHHFYEPAPTVRHYESVCGSA